jgi:hypothetical protein
VRDHSLLVEKDRVGDELEGRAKALFGRAERALRARMPYSKFRIAELALDCRAQPRQVALQDEVLRARAHRRDRMLFAHGAGDDDARRVDVPTPNRGHRYGRVEPWHLAIAQDEIPVRIERLVQMFQHIHPARGRLIADPPELAQEKDRVVGVVLDEQDAQRTARGVALGSRSRIRSDALTVLHRSTRRRRGLFAAAHLVLYLQVPPESISLPAPSTCCLRRSGRCDSHRFPKTRGRLDCPGRPV